MEKQFAAFFSDHFRERQQNQESFFGSPDRPLRLLPLKKLYLNSVISKWLTIQSDPVYSYILSGIALAVLLMACFNFVNLSLGLSSRRFKEVGMRKVVGARRGQLVKQYLSESLLLVFLSLLAGAGLALLSIPTFSRLLERSLSFDLRIVMIPFVGLIVLVGVLAGLYPAFVLSRLHPADILKKRSQMQSKKGLRNLLVVVQFGLSILLIITTLSMARQMQFMRTKNLGFNADHLVVIDAGGGGTGLNEAECRRVLSVYRQAVSQQRDLLSATMTSMSFGQENTWGTSFEFENRNISCRMYSIDYDYAQTLGMRIVQGREFSPDFPGDLENSVMVNESLVRVLGWEDPIGRAIPGDNDMLPGKIIGVFADSHLRSLHYEVRPAVFHLKVINGSFRYLLIRIAAENVPETLDLLENIWKVTVPNRPFLFSFLDEDVDRVFKEDKRWVDISRYSALFAILIACLGAFSLTSLALARRTKEVGVRKVLGASVIRIALLLTKDLFLLVLFANAIAWPSAYLLLRIWLQDFAYRTTISIELFLLGAVLTVLIALATISIQVLKAANADPVDSLRYE
jgi:putative ABC transport system permease protein